MSSSIEYDFIKKRHVKFFLRCLNVLPDSCSNYDTSRMVMLFFALSGLDILNSLEEIPENDKFNIIEWIISKQIIPNNDKIGGFVGGSSVNINDTMNSNNELINGHITMTYSALASLLILGDDLARVDKVSILNLVGSLQCSDGSFYETNCKIENDMRFVYCAACVCYLLDDFSTINLDSAVEYILSSESYEGGFGQKPHLESHGGSTFCAVASLYLFNKLNEFPKEKKDLILWLASRQEKEGGLNGRPNKSADTCYTFWICATLKILGSLDTVNNTPLLNYVLSAQDPITGGICKYPSGQPDGLHSYLGISGLSLFSCICEKLELNEVNPALNISQRALNHLKRIQKRWITS